MSFIDWDPLARTFVFRGIFLVCLVLAGQFVTVEGGSHCGGNVAAQ